MRFYVMVGDEVLGIWALRRFAEDHLSGIKLDYIGARIEERL